MPAYREKTNNTWRVVVNYSDHMNKSRQTTKRGFSTKREALEWEREFLLMKSKDIKMPFGQFVKIYMEDLSPRLLDSTQEIKNNIIESKILPFFQSMSLSEITAAQVVQWQNQLLKAGYSDTYLKTLHNQLSAIFNHAIRLYGLKTNPARIAGSIGSKENHEMKFWTKEQYLAFSQEMMDEPVAYYAFQVLYWCGLRVGELLALTRNDIDLDEGTINVDKTFMRIHGRDVIHAPKTPTGRRKVQMPAFLVAELSDYFTMLYGLSREQRIFQIHRDYLQRKMIRGSEQAGLPHIRIHDLRHSHCALLFEMGIKPLEVAERLGHERVETTLNTYAHLYPNKQQHISDKLEKIYEGGH